MPIEASFNMTPEMYQQVTRELLRRSFGERRGRIWMIMGIGMAALLLLLFGSEGFHLQALLIYGPVLLFMGLLWWLILRYMPGFLVSKKRFPAEHLLRYTFSTDGVKIMTPTSESLLQWSGYLKAQETAQWLLLYPNKMMANPVLKSAFAPGDLDRLRLLLRQKGLMQG